MAGGGGGPIIITMLDAFKTYFGITTEKYYIATGDQLQAFLTAQAANILSNDPAFALQTALNYAAYSGDINNGVSSTQKWVKPFTGLLNTNVSISMILYTNTDASIGDIMMRVTNSSISTSYGYPGITGGGGGGPIEL